jgi:Tfp pilus assembly protein PilO
VSARNVFYGLIVGLLLAVGGGFIVYSTFHSRLEAQSSNIETKKAELAASDDKLKLTILANNQFEQLNDVNDIIGNIIPDNKAQSDVVADVTVLAQRSNTTLNSINFNSSNIGEEQATSQTVESDYPGLRKLPVTVTVEASYDQLLQFLQEIESNQRKITVDSIAINPSENGRFAANLIVNFYVRAS